MVDTERKKTATGKQSAYHCFDQMAWPLPGQRLRELEHTLRHGHPDARDIALAASVVAAYRDLVLSDKEKREKVATKLKRETVKRGKPTI